ncbi:hypothetical protein Tco_0089006 [Tanacetum coccineum]
MDTTTLKSSIKSSSSDVAGLAAKVRNIEGKIRMPVHNVTFTKPLNDIASTRHDEEGCNKEQSVEANSQYVGNMNKVSNSFASVLQHKHTKKTVAISELRNNEQVEGAAVVIPMEAVKEVSSAFDNTLYGYFIGKRLAFPLVENYVKNTWAKFGLRHVMHKNGFFFFQFSTREGMQKVLESGPWVVGEASKIAHRGERILLLFLVYVEEELWTNASVNDSVALNVINESDSEDVDEELVVEEDRKNVATDNTTKGASTPVTEVCAILESHFASSRLDVTCQRVFRHWHWASNNSSCLKALNFEDTSVGSSVMDISMREFKECVDDIELMDVPRSGLQFTWNQKPQGTNGILKKLDRVMANVAFSNGFVGNYAVFQPYGISDHSPAVLCILLQTNVVKKLKLLKKPLRKLLYEKGNLHDNVNKLRIEMERVQADLDVDPFNKVLRDEEAVYVRAFTDALIMEESFLKQKAKVEWLKVRDSNSAYFHKSVKGRTSRNRIDVVTDVGGDLITGDGVPAAFVSHYEAFLGQPGITTPFDSHDLFMARLDSDQALDMIKNVTAQEVKDAMFSMGNDKSPGPDGYTACFFKECWDIVAADVTCAIQEFFTNGNLLKEINHTIIALIPKVKSPSRINDYRPISCCNVLFKCITKIISNRIKESLKVLISPNQSAFVPGRRISDNILLTQELMHNYHLDRGSPRCAFKVDIQKAYDTVDWGFLKEVLLAFGFHARMVSWIMECVTTTSFSLSINGTIHGYFKGKRGLRQGDPLSPYLFTLIMEVLTLMLRWKVRDSDGFVYHRHCSELEIINLCFANDLFIFAHEGRLLVKYLGVPLVSSRLVFRDCKELIDRIRSRITNWKNKLLSVAGSRIILDIEQLMRGFLWSHGDISKGKAKVSWEANLLSRKESLWVKGIHEYKFRGRHFFDIPYRGCMTWGWRKLLQLRLHIRDYIRYCIGDGATCSLWFDRWSSTQPLADIVSNRDIHRAGFTLSSKVKDDVSNGEWSWPVEWFSKYPILHSAVVPTLLDMEDRLEWHNRLGLVKPFSVNEVWNCIRPRSKVVDWYNVVWFANCIPRHAFHMWLVAKRRLKTQDRLRHWDVNGNTTTVWAAMKDLVGLPNVIGSISVIVDLLIPIAKRRSIRSVVAKLVVAACSYHIWQERNSRLFSNQKRSHVQVTDRIKSSIRLKLLSCVVKKSKDAMMFKRLWDLPDSIFC